MVEMRARSGDIAKVWGLKDVRIGDRIGSADALGREHRFAPPALETVIRPTRRGKMPELHDALKQAGTQVYEPVSRFELEVPAESASAVLLNLVECGAVPETTRGQGCNCLVEGTIPARTVQKLEQRLPGLSQGEGVMVTRFHGFQPVVGPVPSRRRSDLNPVDRAEYMLRVFGRA